MPLGTQLHKVSDTRSDGIGVRSCKGFSGHHHSSGLTLRRMALRLQCFDSETSPPLDSDTSAMASPRPSVIKQKCSHPQILNSYTPNSEHILLTKRSVLCSSHIFFDLNNIFGPLTPPLSPKLLVPSCLQVLSYHAWSLVFLWLHLSALYPCAIYFCFYI